MDSAWERLLDVERLIQQHFPESVLVGGTAAALHARHRLSLDVDSVIENLRERFSEVLTELENMAGWQTRRVRPPVLILGNFEGVDVGIRQLIRKAPLETESIGGIIVPTRGEMLRIKAWLVVTRNALRDYIDFCALAHILEENFEADMAAMDFYYPQPDACDSTLQQLAKQLAEPRPYDFDPAREELSGWRGLIAPWSDWEYDQTYCRTLSGRVMDLLVSDK